MKLKQILPKPVRQLIKRFISLQRTLPDLRSSTEYSVIGSGGPLITQVFSKISHIPGAFNIDDTAHFHLVLSLQTLYGLNGDLLEIGSFHGRSSAVMAKYLQPEEQFHICDAFQQKTDYENPYYTNNQPAVEDVIANIRIINKNLSKEQLVIHECLSNDLKLAANQRFRFIHIDGGHSEEQTLFDLQLARKHIIKNGIIVVDDYHHPAWPGVAPAVDKFIADNPDFRLFADLNRHGAKGRKVYIIRLS